MADETTSEDEPPAEKPKYDQAFFLGLARQGKKKWNEWRRDPANKDVRVTFAGVDFSEAPLDQINFAGFEFGHHTDFSGCEWRGVELSTAEHREPYEPRGSRTGLGPEFRPGYASFTGATFGDANSFLGAAFGIGASFLGAAFGIGASFLGTTFGSGASFCGAAFGRGATFEGATFGDVTSFYGAAFGDYTDFTGAAFGDGASFDGVAFGNGARFDETHFEGFVKFTGKSMEQLTRDLEASAPWMGEETRIMLEKRHEDSWTRYGSGPDRFSAISFRNARFTGEADFSRRSFERAADFTNTRFYSPPEFLDVTNAARINFTGTYIGFVRAFKLNLTFDSRVPVRLRFLRKLAEEARDHDLERDLYIEERNAERGVYLVQRLEALKKEPWENWPRGAARLIAHLLWIPVVWLYWALADFAAILNSPLLLF